MVVLLLSLRVSSMPIIEFEGVQHDFPEDVTQEEITQTLSSLTVNEEETAAEGSREPHTEQNIIKKDEGARRNKEGAHVAYKDSKGFMTGGVGHMLTDEEKEQYPKGTVIPDTVVKQWFDTDMAEADSELTSILEDKRVHVPDEVFSVLLNMTFNLGKEGLLEFEDMWAAVEVGDWQEVSKQMLINGEGTGKSDWLKQVGNRAIRLSDRMAAIQSNVQEQEAAE